MKYFCVIFILFLSCENDATNINPKRIDDLIESSIFIDINDVSKPSINSYGTTYKSRIFISTIENVFEEDSVRHRVYLEANKFIGGNYNYIDFGTNFTIGDTKFNRDKDHLTNTYDFSYRFDSDSLVSAYNPLFNFIEKPILSNINSEGESSAKDYLPSKMNLNSDKRIKFVNIDAGQIIDKNSELILLFNRDIKKGTAAIGFVFYDTQNKIKFLNLKVNDSGSIVKIDKLFIQKFYQNVNLDNFTCFIWVAETQQLSNLYKSEIKYDNSEYYTAVLINFIQTIEVKF